ncbi:MAG: hypothetical protein ACMUIP_01150 [bacterium]
MFRGKKILIYSFTILLGISLIFPLSIRAQLWTNLPPYNVMWPLWSPPLSPIDPVTGVATPLITSLTKNTVLPVQPAIAYDPCQPDVESFPWLLYNTPAALGGGLLYWDVYYGMNSWPPSYLLDPVAGTPNPIALPLGWSLISPLALKDIYPYVPIANALYSYRFQVPISSLLTNAQIYGLPPLSALPTPIF